MSAPSTSSSSASVWQRSSVARFFRRLGSGRARRRVLVLLIWGFTLLALLYGIENWRGRRAWIQYRNQLEARGEQLDLSAFIPKPVPEAQNFASTPFVQSWFVKTSAGGAAQGWRADDDYGRLSQRVGSKNRPKDTRHFLDLAGWDLALTASRAGTLQPRQYFASDDLDSAARTKAATNVIGAFSSLESVLAELREASRRPACRYPVVYDLENPWGILLPHLSAIKALCQRLELRACAELAAGRSDQALADIKLMFYLNDSVAEEPFLIGFVVRLANQSFAIQPIWEGLAEQRWSEPQLQELQRYLQQLDFLADFKRPLDTERAAGILTADLIRKKGLGLLAVLSEDAPISDRTLANFVGHFIPNGWYYQEQVTYCQLYDLGLNGTFTPGTRRLFPRQVEANTKTLEQTLDVSGQHPCQDVLRHRVLARLLLPALGKIPTKTAIAQVTVDQAALACALERCRLATGQFPEKLDTLVPRFINTLPSDPCNGEPYHYQKDTDGRFVLYSVGWNETDDGGFPGRTLFDEKQGDWVWEYPKKVR